MQERSFHDEGQPAVDQPTRDQGWRDIEGCGTLTRQVWPSCVLPPSATCLASEAVWPLPPLRRGTRG